MWIAKLYDHRKLGLLVLTLFWILVGVGAGVQEYLARQALGRTTSFPDAVVWPLTAALCWIPLTLGIVHLGRRFPLRLPGSFSVWGLHIAASVSVSFVLNLSWTLLLYTMGLLPHDASLTAWALGWSLRWLHVNTLVYWVILGVVYGLPALINRPTSLPSPSSSSLAPRTTPTPLPTFTVPVGQDTHSVPANSIDWIEAAGDYVYLHCGEKKYLLRARMKYLEKRLAPGPFARIHRSSIVNLERVQSIAHLSHGDYEVVLETGAVLRASRSRTDHLAHLLNTDYRPTGNSAT